MPSAIARRRRGFEHEIQIREHRLIADETEEDGGTNSGPRPTELLAASLASCTATTIEMYADRKGWDLGQIEVGVDFTRATPDNPASFDLRITIPADLDADQRNRILVIAGKCPVHRALLGSDVQVFDELQPAEH